MKKYAYLLGVAFALSLFAPDMAAAQDPTSVVGKITTVRTGWNADIFAIVLDSQNQNPFGCHTNNGYMSASNLPGYDTMLKAALLAFEYDITVEVTVDATSCVNGEWPKLIGINLRR